MSKISHKHLWNYTYDMQRYTKLFIIQFIFHCYAPGNVCLIQQTFLEIFLRLTVGVYELKNQRNFKLKENWSERYRNGKNTKSSYDKIIWTQLRFFCVCVKFKRKRNLINSELRRVFYKTEWCPSYDTC